MKNIFLLIILTIIPLIGKSQESYPRYYIQSGDTVGIIYSIPQAQKIYNDAILLDLFKDVRIGCDSMVKKYVVVVNKYEQKQMIDRLLLEQYEKSSKDQKLEIEKHLLKIDNLNQDLIKCNQQLGLKTGQYQNDEEIITILKKQRSWLLGGTIGFGSLSLFLLGAVLVN